MSNLPLLEKDAQILFFYTLAESLFYALTKLDILIMRKTFSYENILSLDFFILTWYRRRTRIDFHYLDPI